MAYVGVRHNVGAALPARARTTTSGWSGRGRGRGKCTPFFPPSPCSWGWALAAAASHSTSPSTSTLKDSKPEVDSSMVKSANANASDTVSVGEIAPTEVNANVTSIKPTNPKPRVSVAKKAPSKPLPEMMTEDVIPAIMAILEKETDISDIELSFQDDKLEGSFTKEEIPYCFWVFFLDGTLEGLKAFSLSSYGAPPSTFEPFLTIERKPTAPLVVFGIQKRLSAQRILPEGPVQSK